MQRRFHNRGFVASSVASVQPQRTKVKSVFHAAAETRQLRRNDSKEGKRLSTSNGAAVEEDAMSEDISSVGMARKGSTEKARSAATIFSRHAAWEGKCRVRKAEGEKVENQMQYGLWL